MSKTILSIVVDTLVAAALLIGGFGIHSASGAPVWLMPIFAIPFMLYLRFRLDPEQISYVGIASFVVVLTLALFVLERFVPREHRGYGVVIIVVVCSSLSQIFSRRRRPA